MGIHRKAYKGTFSYYAKYGRGNEETRIAGRDFTIAKSVRGVMDCNSRIIVDAEAYHDVFAEMAPAINPIYTKGSELTAKLHVTVAKTSNLES